MSVTCLQYAAYYGMVTGERESGNKYGRQGRNGMREKLTTLAAMLAVLCMVALAPALAAQF